MNKASEIHWLFYFWYLLIRMKPLVIVFAPFLHHRENAILGVSEKSFNFRGLNGGPGMRYVQNDMSF